MQGPTTSCMLTHFHMRTCILACLSLFMIVLWVVPLMPWLVQNGSLVVSCRVHWSIFQPTKQVWQGSKHICSLYGYSVLLYDTTFYGPNKIKIISIKLAHHLIKSTEKAGRHVAWGFVNTGAPNAQMRIYQQGVNRHRHRLTHICVGFLCSYCLFLHFHFLFWSNNSNLSSPSSGSFLPLLYPTPPTL